MQRITFKLTATISFLILASQVQGQMPTSTNSYVADLLRFDRNGNGKLDAAERAAMAAEKEPEQQPLAGLPLICEGEAIGGGGGGSSSSQTESQVEGQVHEDFGRVEIWRLHRDPIPQPAEVPIPEQAPQDHAEHNANGYEMQAPPVEHPPSPPRSVGLSKAVQYRLLANRKRQQPKRYRQAAVFGATIGLSKREPARYRPVQSSCCGCTRVDLYVAYR